MKKRDLDAELKKLDEEIRNIEVPPPKTKIIKPTQEIREEIIAIENIQDLPLREKKDIKIPAWYKPKLRAEWRIHKINELLLTYTKGVTNDGITTYPTQKDILEYKKFLDKLNNRKLATINETFKVTSINAGVFGIIKRMDVKYASMVFIFMDNKTIDVFYINDKGRTFDRHGKKYLINPTKGLQFQGSRNMNYYFYFQNNPFQITFEKDKGVQAIIDALLQKQVSHFEFLQALANSIRMNKKLDVTMLFSIFTFLLLVVLVFICLKGFKFI